VLSSTRFKKLSSMLHSRVTADDALEACVSAAGSSTFKQEADFPKPLGWALAALFAVTSSPLIAEDTPKGDSLSFKPSEGTEYTFNTGTLSGKLRAEGESVGPGEVIYSESGQVISRVYGWLNHYRVFSDGVRYGRGMRHLPSDVEAHDDGSVTVVWPAEKDRPFRMQATYRWVAPHRLDVNTEVLAIDSLSDFELFLAS